jgi:excinuclease ABC subunit A
MDEPTTGLHLEDIRKLMRVLDRLVDHGHTVLLIEHNLDVIKLADWIIDMGPEAGEGGGGVVAMGRPEEVAKVAASHTGRWLGTVLSRRESGSGKREAASGAQESLRASAGSAEVRSG